MVDVTPASSNASGSVSPWWGCSGGKKDGAPGRGDGDGVLEPPRPRGPRAGT